MKNGLTPSERLVNRLCTHSFLKLWTHPNPKGKHGKELCDCLIVCGPHIVIISVKDIEYRETHDEVGYKRWSKSAIEKSANQIWGAERWLERTNIIERKDGRKITLPEQVNRRYHRIAVALGGRGKVPLQWGELGHGFVHVCDEYSVDIFFTALNTISDFIEFLGASETIIKSGVRLYFAGGGIEDLIALYILHGRSFDIVPASQGQPGMIVLCEGIWNDLKVSEEFESMKVDLEQSYVWDLLIELLSNDLLSGQMFDMHSKEVTDNELALVTMALEPRPNRAVLAEAWLEFLQNPELKSAARMIQGRTGHAYVFTTGKSDDRESRVQELWGRCCVVRGRLPNIHTVVGIARDRPGTSSKYSFDILYLNIPESEWTLEHEQRVREIQECLGYFKKIRWPED